MVTRRRNRRVSSFQVVAVVVLPDRRLQVKAPARSPSFQVVVVVVFFVFGVRISGSEAEGGERREMMAAGGM